MVSGCPSADGHERRNENGYPPPKEEGVGGGGPTIDRPWPLLIKEGNDAGIFMDGGEPKDHEVCAHRAPLQGMDARILSVLEMILHEPEKPQSVKEVAEQVCLSPSRFGHLFKQETGQRFKTFFRGARMAAAKNLLQDHTLRIKEVAAALGYERTSDFSHDFRKQYGRSPSESRGARTGPHPRGLRSPLPFGVGNLRQAFPGVGLNAISALNTER